MGAWRPLIDDTNREEFVVLHFGALAPFNRIDRTPAHAAERVTVRPAQLAHQLEPCRVIRRHRAQVRDDIQQARRDLLGAFTSDRRLAFILVTHSQAFLDCPPVRRLPGIEIDGGLVLPATQGFPGTRLQRGEGNIGRFGVRFRSRGPDTEHHPFRTDAGQVQHGSIDMQRHRQLRFALCVPALRHGLQDMSARHHVVPAPSLDEGRGRVGCVLIMPRSEKMVLNPKWIGLSSRKAVRCRVVHSMSPVFPTRTRRSTRPASRAPHTADGRAREPLPPARRRPSSPPFKQPVVFGNSHQAAGLAILVPGSVSGNCAALSAFAPM